MKIKTLLGLVGAAAVIVLGLFFLNGSHREFSTSSPEAYEAYQQGHSELRAFHYAEAESLLTLSCELDPEFAMAHAVLAAVLYRQDKRGNGSEARELAEELAGRIPDDIERAKTQLFLSLFDDSEAVQDSLLTYLETTEPENLLVLEVKAQLLFRERDPQADDIYRRILEIDPNFASAYNMLGYAAAARGDYEQAVEYLRKYAFVAPDLANPHDSLGEVLTMIGRYEEAANEFRTALSLQPDFHYSLINLGEVYLLQGRIGKGRAILEKVQANLQGTGFQRGVVSILMRIFMAHGMTPESRDKLAELIGMEEGGQAQYLESILLALDGDSAAARELCNEFLADSAQKAETEDDKRLMTFHEAQFEAVSATVRGDYAESAKQWKLATECFADRPPHETWWLRNRLGEALFLSGQVQEAREQAALTLSYNSNEILALLLLARSDMALGRTAEAHAALDRLLVLIEVADDGIPVKLEALALDKELASHVAAERQ